MKFDFELASQANTFIQMTVQAVCVAVLAIKQHRKKINIQLIMVMCAMGCFFASDLYWGVYITMHSMDNLPKLSPIEIGEIGLCLFLVAALAVEARGKRKLTPGKYIVTSLFCVVNASLWYYWTGSFINTLASLSALWPTCIAGIRVIDSLGVVGKKGWRGYFGGFFTITVIEFSFFFLTDKALTVAETIGYIVWLAGWANLTRSWILSVRKYPKAEGLGPEPFAWTVNMLCLGFFSLYSSSGVMYALFDFLMSGVLILMTISLVRRKYKYDLL